MGYLYRSLEVEAYCNEYLCVFCQAGVKGSSLNSLVAAVYLEILERVDLLLLTFIFSCFHEVCTLTLIYFCSVHGSHFWWVAGFIYQLSLCYGNPETLPTVTCLLLQKGHLYLCRHLILLEMLVCETCSGSTVSEKLRPAHQQPCQVESQFTNFFPQSGCSVWTSVSHTDHAYMAKCILLPWDWLIR